MVSCVHAEAYGNVVFLRLDVCKSDDVTLVDLYVDKGVSTVFLGEGTGYSLAVFDASREMVYLAPLDVDFVVEIEDDTGGFSYETNSTHVFLRMPYYDNAERMVLYHGDDVIYELDLGKELCNPDDICDARENHLSCPLDCGAGEGVSYCDTSADGVCDGDCFPEWDPDCSISTTYPENAETVVPRPLLRLLRLRPRRCRRLPSEKEGVTTFSSMRGSLLRL